MMHGGDDAGDRGENDQRRRSQPPRLFESKREQGERHERRLGCEPGGGHVHAIDQHAEQRAGYDGGNEEEEGDQPDKAGGFRQVPSDPSNGDPLHPERIDREQVAEQVNSETAGFQGINVHGSAAMIRNPPPWRQADIAVPWNLRVSGTIVNASCDAKAIRRQDDPIVGRG